jgi:hypothetical protein
MPPEALKKFSESSSSPEQSVLRLSYMPGECGRHTTSYLVFSGYVRNWRRSGRYEKWRHLSSLRRGAVLPACWPGHVLYLPRPPAHHYVPGTIACTTHRTSQSAMAEKLVKLLGPTLKGKDGDVSTSEALAGKVVGLYLSGEQHGRPHFRLVTVLLALTCAALALDPGGFMREGGSK